MKMDRRLIYAPWQVSSGHGLLAWLVGMIHWHGLLGRLRTKKVDLQNFLGLCPNSRLGCGGAGRVGEQKAMVDWRGRRGSNNIEDRRSGGGGVAVKGGIGTVILALVLWGVFGIDPRTTMGVGSAIQQRQQPAGPVQETEESARTKQFMSVMLADTEAVWSQIFRENGQTYQPPKMVLFSNVVQSGCGTAQSAMGPFYCPADQKVYLDMTFFNEMRSKLGISGEQGNSGEASSDQAGDFAQAYVIAHEVGHHVQNLLGIASQVSAAQQRAGRTQANALSVRQELQADCFAGVWANRNQQRVNFLQQGDLEEAINAASAIGDDKLQQQSQGYVRPDSFTHGSSAQRVQWFQRGLQSGRLESCDTFNHNA